MNRKLASATIASLMCLGIASPSAYSMTDRIEIKGQVVNKTTENRIILNLWGRQSEEINRMYDAVHSCFTKDSTTTYSDVFKNKDIQRLAAAAGLDLAGGPMLGQISRTGVSIWVRTFRPSEIYVRYRTENGREMTSKKVRTGILTDLTATIDLKGLKPGRTYGYDIYLDGKKLDIPGRKLSFHTVAAADGQLQGRIAFGSCYHRWGLGNQKMSDLIVSRHPDAMLLLGDVAVQDKKSNAALHRDDYFVRDLIPAWRSMVSEVPVYFTWDDHDYMNNDWGGIPAHLKDADRVNIWNVARYAWNNPAYGFGNKGKGLFFHTVIGAADVIMVDNRYFREKGAFLGKEQMQWLKKELLSCRSPFIILSCGTMWADYVSNGKDSWGAFDKEGREEIFRFIEENDIKGVLLISGDRHGARGFTIPRENGFSYYEFGGASLGARSGAPATKPEWKTQLYGIVYQFAFSEFEFGGTRNNPQVTFRLIHEDGHTIYEETISRDKLTPSRFR